MPDWTVQLVVFHLTCIAVDLQGDPPEMQAEEPRPPDDPITYICPACATKITLDVLVTPRSA